MLVLSRKKNETIIIDGHITIEVVQVRGKGVRLGIKAPSDVRILRGELNSFESIQVDQERGVTELQLHGALA